ncbi:MAG: hypothetical protein K8H88_29790 [Sandaracinaceae bacterium]|nr:hypothetical protein [Sandaracinaceae bacterium]
MMQPPRSKSKRLIALRLVAAVALLAAILACGGTDESSTSTTTTSATSPSTPAATGGSTALAIPALNLHITAPADATVSELLGSQTISGSGLVVSVKAAGEMDPTDLAAARHEADLFTPRNLVDETLPDGWVLTYENTGGMGTNYWVTARRTIDGTSYMCSTMAADAAQQRAAVDACKSLRR